MERPCKLHTFSEITSQIPMSTSTHSITFNKPQEQKGRELKIRLTYTSLNFSRLSRSRSVIWEETHYLSRLSNRKFHMQLNIQGRGLPIIFCLIFNYFKIISVFSYTKYTISHIKYWCSAINDWGTKVFLSLEPHNLPLNLLMKAWHKLWIFQLSCQPNYFVKAYSF